MIDDRIEDGLSEAEAVEAVGPVDELVRQAVADVPLQTLVKQKLRPERTRSGWEIALLIVGFPLWFPLLLAAAAVVFSLYLSIWAMVISLFAVVLSLFVSGLALLFLWIPNLSTLNLGGILIFLGAGFLLVGLSILLFYASLAAARGAALLGKKLMLGIKHSFIRKEK
jgi:uncharacterized membrane protein